MIITLSDQACRELLATTSIGRFGFVHDGEVLIVPVTYRYDGSDIIVRTREDGLLSALPDTAPVSFEVDYHASDRAIGWSVLMHGSVQALTSAEAEQLEPGSVPVPWAGGDRQLYLRFGFTRISGRRVRREHAPARAAGEP